MNREQIDRSRRKRAKRIVTVGAMLSAALIGVGALVTPFVRPTQTWLWELRREADLSEASVNAELLAIDEAGARLAPQGTRPVSLITPPLALPSGSGRTVSIRAFLPDVPQIAPRPTRVLFLWQTEPIAGFHFAEQTVPLSEQPVSITFSTPSRPSDLHRFGVQFPDLAGPVTIQSIGLPDVPLGERLRLFGRQITAREPIANHSINFLRGPSALGHTFNYFLLSALVAAVGVYGSIRLLRARPVSTRVVAGIVLVVWLAADLQATKNLSRHFRAETALLRGKPRPEQIAVNDGPPIAWAYVQMLEHSPPGSTFAVVSDDPFTPAHRLGYLLAPVRTRRDYLENAEYLVVIHAEEAAYDESQKRFQWKRSPPVSAERVAALSPRVYLLRRIPS